VFLLGSTYAVPLSGVAGMTSFRQAVEWRGSLVIRNDPLIQVLTSIMFFNNFKHKLHLSNTSKFSSHLAVKICTSTTKTNRLMLFRKMTAVYSENIINTQIRFVHKCMFIATYMSKAKLSLCSINYASRHEGLWGSGCTDPHNLALSTS
jgi:hypothetical protein